MAFFDKLGDLAKNLGDKASDTIEINKLNGKINSEKSAVAEDMRKIGEALYTRYKEGSFSDEAVNELFTTIDGHNTAIAEAQESINAIRAAAAAPAEPVNEPVMPAAPIDMPSAPAVPASGELPCSCGHINPEGTKFCGSCGSKLEIPAPAAASADNRFCTECGASVPGDSRFCPDCGHRFG